MIELDAWNIRERDDWGYCAQKRAAGQEPQRWHWADGGACFRLDQRVTSDDGRARIISRGTVMTHGGVDDLRAQLCAEAQRQGLAQAAKVLVIADGAAWIWNLAGDRFAQAHRRLDDPTARRHGEPQGSGAIESTCRQYQCRFKRPGQFWSLIGDEGLMCLETFWRNNRWHLLFPHILHGDPSRN